MPQREVKLGCAQLHVVAPLALRIKIKRRNREELSGRSVRQIENMLGFEQASPRQFGIRFLKHLRTSRKTRSQPPREIRTDLRSRGPRHKHRPVPNVFEVGIGPRVSVIILRQPPDVVIAEIIEVLEVGADANLVVKRLRRVVPHFLQPVDPEFRLAGKVRRARSPSHLFWKVAHANQHQCGHVAFRLHKFQIVARVPPSTFSIDSRARRHEAADNVVVIIKRRRRINRRLRIIEMSRGSAQRRRDKVRPVAFVLVEIKIVRQRRAVEILRRVDAERRRSARHTMAHGDGVGVMLEQS